MAAGQAAECEQGGPAGRKRPLPGASRRRSADISASRKGRRLLARCAPECEDCARAPTFSESVGLLSSRGIVRHSRVRLTQFCS